VPQQVQIREISIKKAQNTKRFCPDPGHSRMKPVYRKWILIPGIIVAAPQKQAVIDSGTQRFRTIILSKTA